MKIKLSKVILIVSIVGTILVGVCIANIYKTDISVEDVYGNRDVLGDMNILLQRTGGIFETDNILINKDDEKINKFAKQGNQLLNLTKENINNREVFMFEDYANTVFEDENSLGVAHVSAGTIINNKEKMGADIKIKNKKTNEVEEYVLEMDESISINPAYRYDTLNVKKEGDILYVAVMYSYYNYSGNEEYVDDSELFAKDCNATNLNLYKLNLKNKTSQCIISKEYKGNDLSLKNSAFSNDNKAYFVVDKKDDKSDKYRTNLLEFDIKSKDINFIDLGTKDDYITTACTVEDNEVLLLSIETIDGLYTGIREEVNGILVDLKKRDLKYTYRLDMNYSVFPNTTDRVRRYDGKIYALSSGGVETEEYEKNYEKEYNFYVFDEKNGEKLYEGKTKINSNYIVNLGIVTNDEIE